MIKLALTVFLLVVIAVGSGYGDDNSTGAVEAFSGMDTILTNIENFFLPKPTAKRVVREPARNGKKKSKKGKNKTKVKNRGNGKNKAKRNGSKNKKTRKGKGGKKGKKVKGKKSSTGKRSKKMGKGNKGKKRKGVKKLKGNKGKKGKRGKKMRKGNKGKKGKTGKKMRKGKKGKKGKGVKKTRKGKRSKKMRKGNKGKKEKKMRKNNKSGKRRPGKKGNKTIKRKGGKGNKRKKGKNGKKEKKGQRKNGANKGGKSRKGMTLGNIVKSSIAKTQPKKQARITCNIDFDLVKKYQKHSNQRRQIDRMLKKSTKSEKFKNESLTNFTRVFQAISGASYDGTACPNEPSEQPAANTAYQTLKECNVTAVNMCNLAVLNDTFRAKAEECLTQLKAFTNAYENCKNCTCVNDLPDDLVTGGTDGCDRDPAYWRDEERIVLDLYKDCKNDTIEGSYGYCRKQEDIAAYLNYECVLQGQCTTTPAPTTTTTCHDDGSNTITTTVSSAGRRYRRYGSLFNKILQNNA